MKDALKNVLETTQGWKRKVCLKRLGHTEASAQAFLAKPVEVIEEIKPEEVAKKARKSRKKGD